MWVNLKKFTSDKKYLYYYMFFSIRINEMCIYIYIYVFTLRLSDQLKIYDEKYIFIEILKTICEYIFFTNPIKISIGIPN